MAEAKDEEMAMTTLMRVQPMAASVGSLAAERERLEAEIQKLSAGLPDGAAEIVRQADALMAEHGARLSELKSRRDAIDAHFDVTERDRRAAAEAQREAQVAATRQALLDAEGDRLQAVADAEAACRGLADAITRALASTKRMIGLSQSLSPTGKVPMQLSANDLVMRIAARISAVMWTVADDKGFKGRLGEIQWKGVHSAHPVEQDWRQDEQKRIAVGIGPLLGN